MADRPIIMPRLYKREGQNRFETLGGQRGLPDGSNDFLAKTLVVLTSGSLIAVATDGVLVLGQSPDESKSAATVNPPDRLYGDRHWPFNLIGALLLINISNDANAVGSANSAPQLSDVTVGSSYGLTRPTSGTYSGYQFLNVQETSNTLFTVVDKPPIVDGVANVAATYNGIVLVKVIPTKIQAIA